LPDDQHSEVLALPHDLMPDVVGVEETLARECIGNRVAGRHDLVAPWT
jgi:hypothetical protein